MTLLDRARAYPAEAGPTPSPANLSDAQIAVLVKDYLPLVLNQVDRVWLSPRIGLLREDLISAGCYGLLLAARRFDPSRGVGFGVFARSHVHGALMREINAAMRASGIDSDQVLTAANDPIEPDTLPALDQLDQVRQAETIRVRELMECLLTEHERTLLALYFFEELTLAEIAAVLGGSESAAARGIKSALAKLKAALAEGDQT